MEPTLLTATRCWRPKYPYGYSTASVPVNVALPSSGRVFGALPARGDVVVFRWPGDTSQAWVKRVVGLPGDRVQMRGGHLSINGKAVDIRADGYGRAEDEAGYGTTAARYVETLPGKGSRAHTIFKLRTHGPLDDTPEVHCAGGPFVRDGR